jgi:CarD family transcriptional regulator
MPPEAATTGARERAGSDFEVGDTVVLAHHGVGTVVERSVCDRGTGRRDYLTVELPHRSLTLRIPTEALARGRLRPVATAAELRGCLNTLEAAPEPPPSNWTRYRNENLAKLGSGEPRRLAEVVRDLAHLSHAKPLATTHRGLYQTARELLESELMAALELDQPAAAAEIDRRLSRPSPHGARLPPARERHRPTRRLSYRVEA